MTPWSLFMDVLSVLGGIAGLFFVLAVIPIIVVNIGDRFL